MFPKRARFWLTFLVLLSLTLFTLAACGKGDDEAEMEEGDGEEEAAVPYKAPATLGSITGTVTLSGAVPASPTIDMSADPTCNSKNPNAVAETVVATADGKLRYAFVYIKDGQVTGGNRISGYSFPVPGDAVKLDQQGCQYTPHVLGIQANQKFQVLNSDPTAHNINVQPKGGNPAWNVSQPPSAAPIEKTFARPETLIPLKCNQHPWMKAYVGVLKHPFFFVSNADGTFTINNVPPGKYTVVAWHERFGEMTKEVTVTDSGAVTADFAFDSSKTVAEVMGGSLELMPALEFPMLAVH